MNIKKLSLLLALSMLSMNGMENPFSHIAEYYVTADNRCYPFSKEIIENNDKLIYDDRVIYDFGKLQKEAKASLNPSDSTPISGPNVEQPNESQHHKFINNPIMTTKRPKKEDLPFSAHFIVSADKQLLSVQEIKEERARKKQTGEGKQQTLAPLIESRETAIIKARMSACRVALDAQLRKMVDPKRRQWQLGQDTMTFTDGSKKLKIKQPEEQ